MTAPALSLEPDRLLEGLASELFQERAAAEDAMREWAAAGGAASKDWLVVEMERSADPEVETRLRRVLREAVVRDAIATGPGYVGVQMAEIRVMLPGEKRERGAVSVLYVEPGSPGAAAGVKVGDAIVFVDEEKWLPGLAVDGFRNRIVGKRPGEKVRLGLFRDGVVERADVVLAPRPLVLPNPAAAGMPRAAADLQAAEDRAREELFRNWLAERKRR